MNFANRICKLPVTSAGVVNAVLAIILVLTMLGIFINWFVRTFGLFIGLLGGGALIAAVCSTFILLANIRGVLEESRAIGTDSTEPGKTLAAAREGSEMQKADEGPWMFTKDAP